MPAPALQTVWKRLHGATVDFVYPPACVLCGQDLPLDSTGPSKSLCVACQTDLAPPPLQDCGQCGAPVGPFAATTGGCPYCRDDNFAFETVCRLNVYEGRLREACLLAKSAWGEPMARTLAELVWERCGTRLLQLGCQQVIAIPPHWTRRFTQPHSAPETIARTLAARLAIPVCARTLVKIRRTPRQAGASPTVRRQQQRGVFRCRRPSRVAGQTILLVDDILTTGSTVQAAAKALKSAGAGRIVVAAIARGLGRHA